MNLVHLHLLLNHWPIIGSFIALGIFIVALLGKSHHLTQASLVIFSLVALLSIPTYITGSAAQQVIRAEGDSVVPLMATHEGAALLALVFIEMTGALAWLGLWQCRRAPQPAAPTLVAVLASAIVTVGFVTVAGNTGGAIHHPEILSGPQTASAVGTVGLRIDAMIQAVVVNSTRWVWAALEVLHFFGLALLFAGTGVLNLRVLGFLKSFPVSPLYRLLPWSLAGLGINIVTGMLFFLGMPYFYVYNLDFLLKICAVVLAGVNLLLHCTPLFPDCHDLGPGQDAPLLAKFFAATSLVLWLAVIAGGRYMPLFEDTLAP